MAEMLCTEVAQDMPGLTMELGSNEHYGTPEKHAQLLKAGYDVIVVPLHLPMDDELGTRFASLHLAELVHLSGSSVRLVLWSGTNAPERDILEVFDAFWGLFVPLSELEAEAMRLKALEPRRHRSPFAIAQALARLLAYIPDPSLVPNAHAHGIVPASYQQYRASIGTQLRREENGVKQLAQNSIPPLRLFLSYSHQDESLREELEVHLKGLERTGLIARPWSEREIQGGSEWSQEIETALAKADIIVLLVSADFIASDYCYTKEMTAALARHSRDEAKVIPVILRPTDNWASAPFARLRTLPRDGKPVTAWSSRDEAWVSVVREIRIVCEGLKAYRANLSA